MIYDCMIIADRQGKAWDFAYSIYEILNKKSKKFGINEVEFKQFKDGEIKAKIKENVRKTNCFFIHDSSKEPARWFLELALVNEALKNSSANEITDILPYMKFARQDRKDESRTSISSRVVANTIGLYANRVITCELHSPQLQGFYSIPVDNLYTFPIFTEFIKENHKKILENVVVLSPDAGGAVRAKALANRLGINDIAIGYKYRKEAGKVDDFKILGDVNGKNVIMVDDIIDSGGTIITCAKEAREQGAKEIYVCATHGIFTENARDKLVKEVDKLFITNTIPQPEYEGIEIINVERLFADAIYCVNEGTSLSKLFE